MNPTSLQLIEVEEISSPEKVDYRFHLNPEAKKTLLAQNQNTLICPVAICGKFRGGKSFLANLLLGQMQGFGIGSSVNACTQGLWVWSKAAKTITTKNSRGQPVSVFILDCEGSQSTNRGSSTILDSKLAQLVMLISSVLIWNSSGVIEESDISQLGGILKMTDH
jgi:hypothetical protein